MESGLRDRHHPESGAPPVKEHADPSKWRRRSYYPRIPKRMVATAAVGLALFSWMVLLLRGTRTSSIARLDRYTSTRHQTTLDRVSISVISSKGTFDRVEKYASAWRTPEVRLSVWVDELPLFLPDDLEGITHVSTAMAHPWWNSTKKDHHTRLAWTIVDVYNLHPTGVDWYFVIDDDTIVFTPGLLSVLSKYDPQGLWYIGNDSEDMSQIQVHGRMAYGGGGYVVSVRVAQMMAETMAECLPRYDGLYGQDARVFACASELDVAYTRELGFHQMDLEGDIKGLLESHPPAPLVTLHHLQSVEPVFPHLPVPHARTHAH